MKSYYKARTNKKGVHWREAEEVSHLLADIYEIKVKVIFRDKWGAQSQPFFIEKTEDHLPTWDQLRSPDAIAKHCKKAGVELAFLLSYGSKTLLDWSAEGVREYKTVAPYVPVTTGAMAVVQLACHEVAHGVHTSRYGRVKGEQHPLEWLKIYQEMLELYGIM